MITEQADAKASRFLRSRSSAPLTPRIVVIFQFSADKINLNETKSNQFLIQISFILNFPFNYSFFSSLIGFTPRDHPLELLILESNIFIDGNPKNVRAAKG
jgi:hypothetical protein